jgi:hypothetical protein
MNINRLTQNEQEGVNAAQALAQRNGQPEFGPLHLPEEHVDRRAEQLSAPSGSR